MEEAIALDSIQAIAASFGASFDAEKIVDTVLEKDGTRYYKVRWVKYSWEPAASFTHLEHLIGEFWNQYGQSHTQELHLHPAKRIRDSKHLAMPPEIPSQVAIPPPQGSRPNISTIFTTLSTLDPIVGNVTQSQSGYFQPEISGNFSQLSNLNPTPHHGNHETAEMIPSMQQMMHVVGEHAVLAQAGDLKQKAPKKPRAPKVPKIPKEKKVRLPGDPKKPRKKVPGNCPICGKYFKSTTNIAAHKKLHTEERQHECPQCHRKFRRKLHLRRHLESHAGIKNYSCNICGAAFSSKWYMEAHAVIHTGAKPYQCETCEKRFNNKANLNKHKLIHQGKRPFVCNVCGHSYRQSYDLKRHMGTHTAEKDYSCEYCNKSFARKTYLARHMVTHKGEKKFECTLCDRKFFEKEHLTFHMQHHDEKDDKKEKVGAKDKKSAPKKSRRKTMKTEDYGEGDKFDESIDTFETSMVTNDSPITPTATISTTVEKIIIPVPSSSKNNLATTQMDVLQQAAQSCMQDDSTGLQLPQQSTNDSTTPLDNNAVDIRSVNLPEQPPSVATHVISKNAPIDTRPQEITPLQSGIIAAKAAVNNYLSTSESLTSETPNSFAVVQTIQGDVNNEKTNKIDVINEVKSYEQNYFTERNNPILEFPPPSHEGSSDYI